MPPLTRDFDESGRRESNPRSQLGKIVKADPANYDELEPWATARLRDSRFSILSIGDFLASPSRSRRHRGNKG